MAEGGFVGILLVGAVMVAALYLISGGSFTGLFDSFLGVGDGVPVDDEGNPIGTQIYLSSNLEILADVKTWVEWTSVAYDHAGMSDIGVDPYNLTIPADGDYHVAAQIRWEAYEPLSRTTSLMINDINVPSSEHECAAPAGIFFCSEIVTLSLVDGDKVAVRVDQDSDKALDILSGAGSSRLTITPVV